MKLTTLSAFRKILRWFFTKRNDTRVCVDVCVCVCVCVCSWTQAVWSETLNPTACTVGRITKNWLQWRHVCIFRDCACFKGEKLSAPHPTPKLEDHPLSALPHCLFNIFVATLHNGGRSSTRNLNTRHSVVTGTHWKHIVTKQQIVSSVTGKKKTYNLQRRSLLSKRHRISRYKCIHGHNKSRILAARRLSRTSQILNIITCSPSVPNSTQIGQEIWII
jgi:hypothetical protein